MGQGVVGEVDPTLGKVKAGACDFGVDTDFVVGEGTVGTNGAVVVPLDFDGSAAFGICFTK